MPQTVSRSYGNVEGIFNELTEPLRPTGAPAIAFLACDPDIDHGALIRRLHEALPFPVVGGTTLAFPLHADDENVSATLTLLEREGLHISTAISGPLAHETADAQMQALYAQCVEGLPDAPELFFCIPSRLQGSLMERLTRSLFHLAGSVPVFGGMSSEELEKGIAHVFHEGSAYRDCMLLIGFCGGLRPVTAVRAKLTALADYAPCVTKSEGSRVYRLDDMTVCAYLEKLGFPVDREKEMTDMLEMGFFHMLMRGRLHEDDGVPEICGILSINAADGSAEFSTQVPEGVRLTVGTLRKQDVVESAEQCLDELLLKMKPAQTEGYQYSFFCAISCVSRYLAMVGDENMESTLLRCMAPEGLSAFAYHGFNEIAPTQDEAGKHQNRAHGDSIAMLAL